MQQELEQIVAEFNTKFLDWSAKSGCVATFGWQYGSTKFPKALEIVSIDKIVYRKAPPKLDALREAMQSHSKDF